MAVAVSLMFQVPERSGYKTVSNGAFFVISYTGGTFQNTNTSAWNVTSCGPVHVYTVCRPVHMYTSCGPVHVYTVCRPVHVYTSRGPVHVYTAAASLNPTHIYIFAHKIFHFKELGAE